MASIFRPRAKIANSMLDAIKKRKKYLIPLAVIFFIGLALFSILIILTGRLPKTDDTIFQHQILPYHTLFDWVIYRYQNWSGRIFPEAFVYIFSPAPIYFWKIVSIVTYAVFTVMIFLYYRLFDSHHNKQKDLTMLALAFCIPFLMHTDVLRFGIFWVTGSMNYFWIATLGLVGFYPIAYYVARHRLAHWAVIALGMLASIIASCSQEQVGAILAGLSFIFLIYELYMHKKKGSPLPMYLVIATLVIFVSFLIGIIAPGNAIRLRLETLHWLPDFYTIALPQHIEYGFRWFLEATINHSGFLLALSWGLLALLFIKKHNKTKLQNVITYLLVFFCLAIPLNVYSLVGHWFSFYAVWKPMLPNMLSYITFIPWSVAIMITIAAPIILFGKENKGRLISLLYLTAFASIGLLTMSPTMYASGWRTLFVPSVVLVLITYLLVSEVIDKYTKYKYHLATAIIVIALLDYSYLALRLIHKLIS